MRLLRFLVLSLFLELSCLGQFTGGDFDGSAHAVLLAGNPPLLPDRFRGGAGAGFDYLNLYSEVVNSPTLRFAGGTFDGYGMASLWAVGAVVLETRFFGGPYDGYANQTRLIYLGQAPALFIGGGGDGYHHLVQSGFPNPLRFDTDNNGFPDWWEMKYFGLIGVRGDLDADSDQASNATEYLSHTDPTNAFSFFHITRLEHGETNRVYVLCEPGLSYSLLYTESLDTGNWRVVTTNATTDAEKEVIVLDVAPPRGGFYRALINR